MNDIKVLWTHYSSWLFYTLGVYEAAKLEGIDLSWLPHWSGVALALAGIAAKLYRQAPPRTQP